MGCVTISCGRLKIACLICYILVTDMKNIRFSHCVQSGHFFLTAELLICSNYVSVNSAFIECCVHKCDVESISVTE
jgi:hypothetical protein